MGLTLLCIICHSLSNDCNFRKITAFLVNVDHLQDPAFTRRRKIIVFTSRRNTAVAKGEGSDLVKHV